MKWSETVNSFKIAQLCPSWMCIKLLDRLHQALDCPISGQHMVVTVLIGCGC